jgi:hypothetical protein
MNEVWNLDPIYKGFDDPAFGVDMERFGEMVKQMAELSAGLAEGDPLEGLRAWIRLEEEAELFSDADVSVVTYGSLSNPSELAAKLFDALRTLDDLSPDVIFAREPKNGDGIELAVVNRLSRAAAFSLVSI